MKKKDFISLILSVMGVICFALGMCMSMISEWKAFDQGIVLGVVGLVILLMMLAIRRRMEGKPIVRISGKTIGILLLGVAGILALGIGLCMTIIWNRMASGILVGLIGIVLLVCLVPLIKGIES